MGNKYLNKVMMFLSAISVIALSSLNAYAAADNDRISSYVDEYKKGTGCDSVSVVVLDNGEASYYGDADRLYQIGSMTKAFTGLATRKLISEGRLSEDSKVSELIQGYEAYYGSEQKEITVRQLLDQTSGYTNKESDYPSAEKDMTLKDWALSMSGKELASEPGSEYAYSNVNFDLLGAIIEEVTGKSYSEYMESEILAPLGLNNTYVHAPNEADRITEGSRLGYRHAFRYEIPVIEGRIPAGYFYSNAKDMTQWLMIWQGSADIPEEYKALIDAVKAELTEVGDYRSGWELFNDGVIGHSGGTPNYSSRIIFSDDKKVGVCVLTNLNVAASTDGLCNGIYSMVTTGDSDAIPADVWTVFDIIFTCITLAGIIILIAVLRMKRRSVLIVTGAVTALLVLAICIVMPLVFGAGLFEILFTWGPYSMTGGLMMLFAVFAAACIKVFGSRGVKRS